MDGKRLPQIGEFVSVTYKDKNNEVITVEGILSLKTSFGIAVNNDFITNDSITEIKVIQK